MSKKQLTDHLEKFHGFNVYLPTRTIYLGSEQYSQEHGESGTDGAMAERLIKNLHVVDSMEVAPIHILMNNIGGCLYSAFAIIDAIQSCRSHITITAMGHAMSAGSLILQAADERVMAPLAVQMIHYGSMTVGDNSKTFQKWAKEGQRLDGWMEKYYLDRIRQVTPKFPLSRLQNMLSHDTFLSAAKSVELGLADRIVETG